MPPPLPSLHSHSYLYISYLSLPSHFSSYCSFSLISLVAPRLSLSSPISLFSLFPSSSTNFPSPFILCSSIFLLLTIFFCLPSFPSPFLSPLLYLVLFLFHKFFVFLFLLHLLFSSSSPMLILYPISPIPSFLSPISYSLSPIPYSLSLIPFSILYLIFPTPYPLVPALYRCLISSIPHLLPSIRYSISHILYSLYPIPYPLLLHLLLLHLAHPPLSDLKG